LSWCVQYRHTFSVGMYQPSFASLPSPSLPSTFLSFQKSAKQQLEEEHARQHKSLNQQLSKGSLYRTEKEKLVNQNRELAETTTVRVHPWLLWHAETYVCVVTFIPPLLSLLSLLSLHSLLSLCSLSSPLHTSHPAQHTESVCEGRGVGTEKCQPSKTSQLFPACFTHLISHTTPPAIW